MQYQWLNKQDNENLIVFFCGWSFDYKPFKRLDCGCNDVLCIYDYGDIGNNNCCYSIPTSPVRTNTDEEQLPHPLREEFLNNTYKNYSLITWSMGVYVAYLLRNSLPEFNLKIAVNGTPYPVDNEFGISHKSFELTLKHVEIGLQGKFQRNLFKRPEDFEIYLENPVTRTIENQKQELIALDDYIRKHEYSYTPFYNRAIISDTDKIVPTKNQLKFWENKAEIITLDNGHFPFFEFNCWEDILKCKQTLKQ